MEVVQYAALKPASLRDIPMAGWACEVAAGGTVDNRLVRFSAVVFFLLQTVMLRVAVVVVVVTKSWAYTT